MGSGAMRNLILIDDHDGVREALARLLEESGSLRCDQAKGREEALGLLEQKTFDLALLDVSLGDGDGLGLMTDLGRRGIPVAVCSSHEEPKYVQRALEAGARAYLAKRDASRALLRTVTDVLDGWVLISPHAADDLSDGGPSKGWRREDSGDRNQKPGKG